MSIFILIFLCFRSAWISLKNIYEYSGNKENFAGKNKTATFKKAIEEINYEYSSMTKNMDLQTNEQNTRKKITLTDIPVAELLATFDSNKIKLEIIFNYHRSKLDRFIRGNGYDFLTVLSRIVTSEQQQAMYVKICNIFMKNFEKYIQNPIVSKIVFVNNEYTS